MRSILCVVFSAGLAMHALAAAADADADIKYRQSVMKVSGGHMAALVALLKGQVDHKEDLALHADGMAGVASMVPHLFPAGSDKGKTKAKAEIWQTPDDFKAKIKSFQDASQVLTAAVKGGKPAELGAAVGQLGKACKSCHDQYEAKE